MEIHRKPGYDPAELFFDPEARWAKARAGAALVRKKLGMRYLMSVVGLEPAPVRGSHGRLPATPADGPVLLCTDASVERDRFAATDVNDLLLALAVHQASPRTPRKGSTMCYGYDGEGALRRSLAEKGASRRGLFKAAGVVALGGAALATTGVHPPPPPRRAARRTAPAQR